MGLPRGEGPGPRMSRVVQQIADALTFGLQDDLLSLKVGSVLHHLSIKRAIQVLRLNNYEPNCLRRRPSDEVQGTESARCFRPSVIPHICSNRFFSALCQQNNISPAEISQWTNHRVMEWLRSVDLAEYAPNLRGSGVHGGLMVGPCGVGPPRSLSSARSFHVLKQYPPPRFWSPGSMWRPWLCC